MFPAPSTLGPRRLPAFVVLAEIWAPLLNSACGAVPVPVRNAVATAVVLSTPVFSVTAPRLRPAPAGVKEACTEHTEPAALSVVVSHVVPPATAANSVVDAPLYR